MAEVVAFLRREQETLEVRLSLAEQEAARWKGQAAHAERAAAEARQVRLQLPRPGPAPQSPRSPHSLLPQSLRLPQDLYAQSWTSSGVGSLQFPELEAVEVFGWTAGV